LSTNEDNFIVSMLLWVLLSASSSRSLNYTGNSPAFIHKNSQSRMFQQTKES